MNTLKIRSLFALHKIRAFWRKQIHRLHALFGRVYQVSVTYEWPHKKPQRIVTYQREYLIPALGEKTQRGYIVEFEVSVLD